MKDGSFTTLLGPSGCGKTTLLRMIAGLEIPDAGEIYFGNTCVFSSTQHLFIPPEKRGLGFVFQDFALWPHMTVFDNVAFGLRSTGRTTHLDDIVCQALNQVELSDFRTRYPHELSGGQQQRVAFARAIAYGKDCILFDEPLSALDAKLREEIRSGIRNLVSRLHVTAVFVTHDQAEAMEMSDAIAVLSQGHIEQYARPEDIYGHPTTPFVANFIGSSNWIDEHHLFRPEKAHLSCQPGDISYTVSILSNHFQGQYYHIHLDWQDQKWTFLSPVSLAVGQNICLYINPKDIITV